MKACSYPLLAVAGVLIAFGCATGPSLDGTPKGEEQLPEGAETEATAAETEAAGEDDYLGENLTQYFLLLIGGFPEGSYTMEDVAAAPFMDDLLGFIIAVPEDYVFDIQSGSPYGFQAVVYPRGATFDVNREFLAIQMESKRGFSFAEYTGITVVEILNRLSRALEKPFTKDQVETGAGKTLEGKEVKTSSIFDPADGVYLSMAFLNERSHYVKFLAAAASEEGFRKYEELVSFVTSTYYKLPKPPLTQEEQEARTALFRAVREGDTEEIGRLLASGMDVDLRDDDGRTPLMAAVRANRPQAVGVLLLEGADTELRDWDGVSALMHAQAAGSTEIMGQILRSIVPVSVMYPLSLEGLGDLRVVNYEVDSPGMGIAFAYDGNYPAMKADIYVYNASQEAIPSDVESETVKQHFRQLNDDIRKMAEMGYYRDLQKEQEGVVTMKDRPALMAVYSLKDNVGEFWSHIYLTSYRNHYVKIRFTYIKENDAAARAVLKQLLDLTGEQISGR